MKKELTNKEVNSNITKFYVYLSLYGLMLPNIVFTIFLLDKGLNYSQVGWLESLFGVAMLLELFGGAFADIIGRKVATFLATLTVAVSCFLYVFSNNFWQFLAVYFIWGAGVAIGAGADTALIYDSLKATGRTKEYMHIYGKGRLFFLTSSMVGALIGSYLYNINNTLPFSIGAFFLLSSAIVFLTAHEKNNTRKYSIRAHFLQIKDGLRYLFFHKNIRWVLFLGGLTTLYFAFFYTVQSPYLMKVGFKITDLGWIFAITAAVEALFAYSAEYLHRLFSERTCFILIILGYFTSSAGFAFAFGPQVLGVYLLLKFSSGFGGTFAEHYMQKHSHTRIRATLSATEGFVLDFVRIISLPIFGWLTDIYSMRFTLLLITGIVLIAGTVLIAIFPVHTHKFEW